MPDDLSEDDLLSELLNLVRKIPAAKRLRLKKILSEFISGKSSTSRSGVGKRGVRVKANPALPDDAPEIYRDRAKQSELRGRKENVVEFLQRVWAPWIHILTRADLRRLDATADTAVENWISYHGALPEGLLPTESELNTTKRQGEARRLSKLRHGLPTLISFHGKYQTP
jgi:hypothetical protein